MESEGNNQSHLKLAAGILAIVLMTFAVYQPVLPGTFLMDDARLVGYDNALVNGQFTLHSIWFQTDFTLTAVGWWVESLMFGKNPLGYHVVNILLHAGSALLLWRLLARLKIPGAWLTGALFAVHPVCVNSVARIAELKNTLSLPFCFLSFIAWLNYETAALYPTRADDKPPLKAKAALWLLAALFLFVLATLAKTTAVMLPVVLLLCAFWQRGRIAWKDFLHTLPFFVLSLGFGLMSMWFQKNQAMPTSLVAFHPASFPERLVRAGYDFWFYLGKALWPVNLNIDYPHWKINAASAIAYLPDVLVLAVFIVCLVFRRAWGRHVLFGLGCFTVMLFPALGFFDAQFEALWQVSDHLQYPALPAIVALAAAALASRLPRSIFRGAAGVLILSSAILCFRHAEVFETEEGLMLDTVTRNPAAWGPRNDLGVIYAERGDYAKAADEFSQSLSCEPDNVEARVNFAQALLLQGQIAEARTQLLTGLKIAPRSWQLNKAYADLSQKEGKNAEALAHLRIVASLNPSAETCLNLAGLEYLTGHPQQAVAQLRQALALKPNPSDKVMALNNLAWILATCPDDSVRNGTEAVRYAEQACQLTGFKQSGMMNALAAAYAEAGRFPEAVATAEAAVKLAEDTGDTHSADMGRQLLRLYQSGKPFHDQSAGH